MTLTYTRAEDADGQEVEVTYEVEVRYDPGRPPPAYRLVGDRNYCDPGESPDLEILSVTRDGETCPADYLDGDLDALYELARDEWTPPERDEDYGRDR